MQPCALYLLELVNAAGVGAPRVLVALLEGALARVTPVERRHPPLDVRLLLLPRLGVRVDHHHRAGVLIVAGVRKAPVGLLAHRATSTSIAQTRNEHDAHTPTVTALNRALFT